MKAVWRKVREARMGDQGIPLMTMPLSPTSSGRVRRFGPDTQRQSGYKFPSNAISNAKYNAVTFVPVILYEQFKFFFNLYFLIVALSQAWPALRIGYLSSYVVPLAFVLSVTMAKEAWDDIQRRRRDAEANSEIYELKGGGQAKSQDLRVGDIVVLHTNERVPADVVVLKSSEASGESFIRTDQLDGETDWKLRQACPLTQQSGVWEDLELEVSPSDKSLHHFVGTIENNGVSAALSVDNTMWANTVVAAGTVEGIVAYTGIETRMAMNLSPSRNKVGLLELEVNSISKILCVAVFGLSFVLVAANGFGKYWYVDLMRFLILFSTIIPVSLRVNLDMAKTVYAHQIEHDKAIPDTIVRTSTIPEDLGRIDYLLTDKTGTITQNDMDLKKIHIGQMAFYGDSMEDVATIVAEGVAGLTQGRKSKRESAQRVWNLVTCLAVCHSVTPTDEGGFQAVSPDEIAIVAWTAQMGIELIQRDRMSMTLSHKASGKEVTYEILYLFPFNSDSKRMGIIVRSQESKEVWFYCKGADTVMGQLVTPTEWLDEEVGNMAREGLRTLVVARKKLEPAELDSFSDEYSKAGLLMHGRDQALSQVVARQLEHNLEVLGITGVEDKLQRDVKPSLELLRHAGVRVWMLTGDKVETARCVAVSARLVSRGQFIHTVQGLSSITAAHQHLDFLSQVPESCLLVDGGSLAFFLDNLKAQFAEVALKLPVVVACRCTPQQKADLTKIVKTTAKKRVCGIGDGGNDVSMIQAADVGVGIVGKEGRQASLAADFSVTQFCHLTRLLLWHGRNSYKRSAKLSQVIIHRGLLISVAQAVYSISSHFEPLALYQGWLMVGYATIYTMAPVFALVTDFDVDERVAHMYPELYQELKTGRSLSYRSFAAWFLVALYQGCVVQGLSQLFVGLAEVLFKLMVMVSFSALIATELSMVAIETRTWNIIMLVSLLVTAGVFIASVPFLGDYFDLSTLKDLSFYWKTAAITAVAVLPPFFAKAINRKIKPPSYAKVQV